LKPLFEREGFDLILDASVLKLESDASVVTGAVCKSRSGIETRIRAQRFVLAAGGIENPRLLLNSRIGNDHDQVGRYFMNHPKSYQGYIRLNRLLPPRSLFLPQTETGRMRYLGLRLAEEEQHARGLLNSYVGFEPNFGRLQRYGFKLWKRMPLFSTFLMRTLARPRSIRCRWFADMEPRADNRVTLSEARDSFGMSLPKVTYQTSERDKATLRALWDTLAQSGLGRLEGDVEEMLADITFDSSHHMGATRMGNDPATSVVDADCRVHGTENLYVAGSSVFPSAGCANPTMVITALSIRLAERLSAAPAESKT
jgi:choline dehydrogenase-like flavoprotein